MEIPFLQRYVTHTRTHTHTLNLCSITDVCLLKWTITFSARFIDRPEQRISLDDFKSFLLESQKVISPGRLTLSSSSICFTCTPWCVCVCMWIQEMWATDSSKVQEFMFAYLKDPLREVEQPYFHQDEVHTPLPRSFAPLFLSCPHTVFLGFLLTNGKM